MQESSVIQHYTEQGIARGKVEGIEEGIARGKVEGIEEGIARGIIESTVSILVARFPDADVSGLGVRLAGISDLDRLRELPLRASLAVSFEAFETDLAG